MYELALNYLNEKVEATEVPVSKFAKIQGGYAFKSNQFQKNNIPIIRIGNIQENKVLIDNNICYTKEFLNSHPEFEIKDGDLLIAMSGATVGKVGIYSSKESALLNQRVGKFIITDKIDSRYLYFLLLSPFFEKFILNNAFGCAQPNISNKQIEEFRFYKYSIEKQIEIADKLDKVQEIIDFRKKQIKELDELIKSMFAEMFENKNYKIKRIDEVAILKSGVTFNKKFELSEGDLLYCKVSDMNLLENEKYMMKSKTYVSKEIGFKSYIPANSVIFPKRGGAIGTNKKRILKKDTCVDLNIMAVIPKEIIDIQYLYYYFINIDLATLCDGSAVPQLNNKNIGPLEIAVPSIENQNKFAKIVEQIDKQKITLEKNLKETEELQESLMNKYFN